MKIVNYGSLNIDFTFQVNEIVRPGQTIDSNGVTRFPGGKGLNQSLALARAGMPVYHAGNIGTDGLFLRDILEKDGVHCQYLQIHEDVGTGSAFIQVNSQGQNAIVLNGGANRKNTETQCRSILQNFAKGDWILLQNEINNVGTIIDIAWKQGLRIIFNPSPMTEDVLHYDLSKVSLFVMNEDEGWQITGQRDPDAILQTMAKKYPHAEVILTLGENGSLWTDGQKIIRQSACQAEAVDTTGAGDTFTGYVLANLAKGVSVEKSMSIAAKASAIAVTRKGAASAIPYRSEVEEVE